MGPGTTSPMRLNVGSGSYAFRCLFEDFEAITGPTVVVGGHARGTPAILPVTRNDLLAPPVPRLGGRGPDHAGRARACWPPTSAPGTSARPGPRG